MRSRKATRAVLISFVILFLSNGWSSAQEVWFNQRVTWRYGKEGAPWKTNIKSPDRERQYQLALLPLWALEGGVVGIEIVVARPQEPDVNLLGERKKGVEYPFVIMVGELERGLARSKFGKERTLHADDMILDVKVDRFRFGKGLGSGSTYCSRCNNLRQISMWIAVRSRNDGRR